MYICVKDSLEDEVCSSSDSNSTQQSISEENLMCYEEGRVPFFKVKFRSFRHMQTQKAISLSISIFFTKRRICQSTTVSGMTDSCTGV